MTTEDKRASEIKIATAPAAMVQSLKDLLGEVVKNIDEFLKSDRSKYFAAYNGINIGMIQDKLVALWNRGPDYQEAILTIVVQQMKGGGNMASLKSQKLIGIDKIRAACSTLGCLMGSEAASENVSSDVLTPSRIGIALHPAICASYKNWKNGKKGADVSYGEMPPLFCSTWGAYMIDDSSKEGKMVKWAHLEWSLRHNFQINKKNKAKFNAGIWETRMSTSQVPLASRKAVTTEWFTLLNGFGLVPGQVYGWTGTGTAELRQMRVPTNLWGSVAGAGALSAFMEAMESGGVGSSAAAAPKPRGSSKKPAATGGTAKFSAGPLGVEVTEGDDEI